MFRKLATGVAAFVLPATLMVATTTTGAGATVPAAPKVLTSSVNVANDWSGTAALPVTSPIDGMNTIPYGAGVDSGQLANSCGATTTPKVLAGTNVTVNLVLAAPGLATGANNLTSSSFNLSGLWVGPNLLGSPIFPTKICHVVKTDATHVSFDISTAPALPTPVLPPLVVGGTPLAAYTVQKGLKLALTITDPNRTDTNKTSAPFKGNPAVGITPASPLIENSACGVLPGAFLAGTSNIDPTTTLSVGDANTIYTDVVLNGHIIAAGIDFGAVQQNFCSPDIGQTGGPSWAVNYPVEMSPQAFTATGYHLKAPAPAAPVITQVKGKITNIGFSFPYSTASALNISSNTSRWKFKAGLKNDTSMNTISAPNNNGGIGCTVTFDPADPLNISPTPATCEVHATFGTAVAPALPTVNGGTVVITDPNSIVYNQGDTITSPTIKLTNVLSPPSTALSTKLIKFTFVGSNSAIQLAGGATLNISFGPRPKTNNATASLPNMITSIPVCTTSTCGASY